MATHDIERTNLAAHVSICEERYLALAERLDSTDRRLARLAEMTEEIHSALQQHQRGQNRQWTGLRDAVILALTGIIGWLANQVWG